MRPIAVLACGALLAAPLGVGAEEAPSPAPGPSEVPVPAPEATSVAPAAPEVPWKDQPVDPWYETSFTAYSVPKGHWRLGPVNTDYGLLENAHVGTAPFLFLLGLPNAHGKVTAIQSPKFDVGVEGAWMFYDAAPATGLDTFHIQSWPVTATASWILADTFSLHFGHRWENVDADGTFDLDTLAGALASALGVDLSDELAAALQGGGALYGGAHFTVTQVRLGVDMRLNRRDSVILLLTRYNTLSGRVDAGYQTEDEALVAGAAVRVKQPLEGLLPATSTVAWQFTWPHLRLRLGIPIGGGDTQPLLWIPQAFELYAYF